MTDPRKRGLQDHQTGWYRKIMTKKELANPCVDCKDRPGKMWQGPDYICGSCARRRLGIPQLKRSR